MSAILALLLLRGVRQRPFADPRRCRRHADRRPMKKRRGARIGAPRQGPARRLRGSVLRRVVEAVVVVVPRRPSSSPGCCSRWPTCLLPERWVQTGPTPSRRTRVDGSTLSVRFWSPEARFVAALVLLLSVEPRDEHVRAAVHLALDDDRGGPALHRGHRLPRRRWSSPSCWAGCTLNLISRYVPAGTSCTVDLLNGAVQRRGRRGRGRTVRPRTPAGRWRRWRWRWRAPNSTSRRAMRTRSTVMPFRQR